MQSSAISTTLSSSLPLPKSHSFPPKFTFPILQNPILPRRHHHNFSFKPSMASSAKSQLSSPSKNGDGVYTLMEYMGKSGVGLDDDLVVLFDHLQYASKRIASLVASPFNSRLAKQKHAVGGVGSERDAPKPLDILSNEIVLSSLRNSGKVAVMASEEDNEPVWIDDDGPFVVVTDPLDGSRNIDASIPTGTIFGVYKRLVELDHLPQEEKAMLNSLQSGARLVAAAYVLYSSATIFCTTFGSGTHAFTLDHTTGDFVLTHPGINIPPREQAGGKGSDGRSRILSLQPVKLHQRLPLFLGSPEDIEELESYGDVQQRVNPGYEV
ncbi:Fructose-1,6-bisphosphatase, chloroplastic [Linum grandiflorum]